MLPSNFVDKIISIPPWHHVNLTKRSSSSSRHHANINWHHLQASPSWLPPPRATCAGPSHQRCTMVHTEIWKAGDCRPGQNYQLWSHWTKVKAKLLKPFKQISEVLVPFRLDFTSAHTQLLSSTTMRTREIFSTKTSSQACLSFFIFPPSCNIEQPILGRPDSFVYRFRMLGGKLGFEQKNNWKKVVISNAAWFSTMESNGRISGGSYWKHWKTLASESKWSEQLTSP